jgi:hypothetical protein
MALTLGGSLFGNNGGTIYLIRPTKDEGSR